MHKIFPDQDDFYWQKGYVAFMVSASQIKPVQIYIASQAKHHKNRSFRDEFIGMLRVNEIGFEEKYLWK